jgi:hypothetical protein
MDTFDSLHNRRVRKIDETKDAKADGKKRLFQSIKNIDFMFRHLKEEDPEGYLRFIRKLLRKEIKELEKGLEIEQEVLGREDVTVKGDIISQMQLIEDRIADIDYYLQELAESNPEPIEA